jgi:hypothetical protein
VNAFPRNFFEHNDFCEKSIKLSRSRVNGIDWKNLKEYTSQISMSKISFHLAGMGIQRRTVTLFSRSLKEDLEKRCGNQDNVVCEKSAEDRCGHHGPPD